MAKSNYSLYTFFRRMVPESVQQALGGSRLLAPARNTLLRPTGEPEIAEGEIEWEDLRFQFCAPYRVFYKAKEKGVENIICRLARSVLQPGDTAIDVGANYGFVTTVMAFSVAPAGRLYSFEIDPGVAAVLATTIELNRLGSVVTLIDQGAGPDVAGNIVTVDSIVDPATRVRFLKIDTDGADLGVLQGATRILNTDHPVVVVEMHEDPQAIYTLLQESGYTHFTHLSGDTVTPGAWPANLIASIEPVTIPEKGSFVSRQT